MNDRHALRGLAQRALIFLDDLLTAEICLPEHDRTELMSIKYLIEHMFETGETEEIINERQTNK